MYGAWLKPLLVMNIEKRKITMATTTYFADDVFPEMKRRLLKEVCRNGEEIRFFRIWVFNKSFLLSVNVFTRNTILTW